MKSKYSVFFKAMIILMICPIFAKSQNFMLNYPEFYAFDGEVWSVEVTDSNKLLLAGNYYGNSTLFGKWTYQIPPKPRNNQGFIWKLDSLRNQEWVYILSSNKYLKMTQMKTDERGNVYFTGKHTGVVYFTDAQGQTDSILNTSNQPSIGFNTFIGRLDRSGNLKWIHSINGTSVNINDIKYDGSGNIYLLADFVDTAYVSNTNSLSPVVSTGTKDGMILRFDTLDGNVGWYKLFTGGAQNHFTPTGMDFDSNGNLIVGLSFRGTVALGSSTLNISTSAPSCGAVIKLTPSGSTLWSTKVSSNGASEVKDVLVADNGQIFVGARYQGTTTIAGKYHANSGMYDGLICGLSNAGNIQWSKSWGGNKDEDVICLAKESITGDIICGAETKGEVIRGYNSNGLGNRITPTISLIRMSSSGVDYSQYFFEDGNLTDIAPSSKGRLFLTGYPYNGTTTDFYHYLPYISSTIYYNGYALEYGDCDGEQFTDTLDIITCKRYNGIDYFNDTLIKETYFSFESCDSSRYVDIKVYGDTIKYGIVQGSNGELICQDTARFYEWFKCEGNNRILIQNANGPVFYPQDTGEYSVRIIRDDYCMLSTDCFHTIGLPKGIDLETQVSLYPNPAQEYVTIEAKGLQIKKVILYTTAGGTMNLFTNDYNKIDISDLSPGLYFVEISTSAGVVSKKVVKQ